MDTFANEAENRIGEFSQQNLVRPCFLSLLLDQLNSTHCFAAARSAGGALVLFPEIALYLLQANLAWAMGKLSHFNEGLLDAIANQATSMVQVMRSVAEYCRHLQSTVVLPANAQLGAWIP